MTAPDSALPISKAKNAIQVADNATNAVYVACLNRGHTEYTADEPLSNSHVRYEAALGFPIPQGLAMKLAHFERSYALEVRETAARKARRTATQ